MEKETQELRMEDRYAISQLRIMYSYYYDTQDLDSLCALFSPEAVCAWDPAHGGTWRGIEQIRCNFQDWFSRFPGKFSVLHAVTNHRIMFTGENAAWGQCFLLDYNFLQAENRGQNPLGTAGIYEDTYIKTLSGWKFAGMGLNVIWQAPKRKDSVSIDKIREK